MKTTISPNYTTLGNIIKGCSNNIPQRSLQILVYRCLAHNNEETEPRKMGYRTGERAQQLRILGAPPKNPRFGSQHSLDLQDPLLASTSITYVCMQNTNTYKMMNRCVKVVQTDDEILCSYQEKLNHDIFRK